MEVKNLVQCQKCGKVYKIRKNGSYSKWILNHMKQCHSDLITLIPQTSSKVNLDITYLKITIKKLESQINSLYKNGTHIKPNNILRIKQDSHEQRTKREIALGNCIKELKSKFINFNLENILLPITINIANMFQPIAI